MNRARAKQEDVRAKILLTLNAIGRKVKAHELAEQAVLNDLTPRQIGQYLKHLQAAKQVRYFPKEHLWAANKERALKTVEAPPSPQETPKIFLMLKPLESRMFLSLMGIQIPILIEE